MKPVSCDTSFLFALYGSDAHTSNALRKMKRLGHPLSLSLLNEFELANAVRGAVFRRMVPSADGAAMLADIESDKAAGRLAFPACDLSAVIEEASRLSATHTLSAGYRAFDMLHVAFALHLGAEQFLTFDVNQRTLAVAEGLKVVL